MIVLRYFYAAVILGVAATPVLGQVMMVPDQTRTLSVTGYGSIVTRPDLATVRLGAFAIDTDLSKAKTSVDSAVNRLIALSSKLAIDRDDLVTSSVLISPQYVDGDPAKFRGYEVTRSLTVKVRDLKNLPRLLDGAIEAGANRDFDITLKASREVDLKREAMAAAIDNAEAQAEFAADRLHVTIGAVRSINLNRPAYTAQTSGASYSGTTTTFLPADVHTDAEVSVSFFIADAPHPK